MSKIVTGLVLYVVFLASTTLHEAAHAWAALKGGDPTAFRGGQVSLNPIAHIRRQPVGLVVLPLISVIVSGWPLGFASAPYDPMWARRYPRRSAWMALAGPGANMLLVILAAVIINVGLAAGVFKAPSSILFANITEAAAGEGSIWNAVGYVVGSVFALNLLLLVFNLLPFPPLDGSGGLILLLPDRVVPVYQELLLRYPVLGMVGILLAWRVIDFLFQPIFTLALNVLYFLFGISYST